MRVSMRWLADYIRLPTQDPKELERVFASLGHEVESIQHLTLDFSGVVTARVEEVKPHPQADRIRLCTVTTGSAPIAVVCGAWNFEAGAVVAFAPPGATLAGSLEITRRSIRGTVSNGMICSERELGLGEEHAGILVLDADTPLGIDVAELVARPDWIFDLAITPNRPDVMSLVGLARELSAHFQIAYTQPPADIETTTDESRVRVNIEDPTGCYRFVGREAAGVTVRTSPFWMRQRLRAAGMRAINHVVDVTNYMMLELGQPLHAFDLDKVAGEQVVVRRARPGERLRTLDGIDRQLTTADLVVADTEAASALAGTMGGEASEVSEGTSRVLIEAAAWDPPTILHMSARHGLRSEASARFERGVDPNLPPIAAARATRLITEIGGGKALAGVQDVVAVEKKPWKVALPLAEVTRLLGPGFDGAAVASLLRRLHLKVSGKDPLSVTVPTYRPDLTRPADLIEEVARLHGFDRFGETVPKGPGLGWSAEQQRLRHLRSTLTGAGLSEALNLSFFGEEDLDRMGYPPEDAHRQTIRVRNPLREEQGLLRTSLLPGLLRSSARNLSHSLLNVALFEIGKVFFREPDPNDPAVPLQPDRLAWVVVGSFGSAALGGVARAADVFTSTAVLRSIDHHLRLGTFELRPVQRPGFHPRRTAEVILEGSPIGLVGELHPSVARSYDLPGRVAAGEIDLAPLVESRPPWQFHPPRLYPPVVFDLAFEVDLELNASALVETTAAAAGDLLEDVSVFDEYRGTSLPEGRKSLAIRYRLRPADRTLTNEEAGQVRAAIVVAAASVGATLRA